MRQLNLPDSAAPNAQGLRSAPSALRNMEPIAEVLASVLPKMGRVLELASGTGEHIASFAGRWPGLQWQPSDVTAEHFATIEGWAARRFPDSPAANLRAPIVLDACAPGWSTDFGPREVITLTNLLHLISQDEAAVLLGEVAKALTPGGVFCLYGPFSRGGMLMSEGDRAFDASLRAQDPLIGYKAIEWVEDRLREAGLEHERLIPMPADNLMLITRRPNLG